MWLDSSVVQVPDPEPEEPHKGAWRLVSFLLVFSYFEKEPRYLLDTDFFNEWMNEIDYELDESNIVQEPRTDRSEHSLKITLPALHIDRTFVSTNHFNNVR